MYKTLVLLTVLVLGLTAAVYADLPEVISWEKGWTGGTLMGDGSYKISSLSGWHTDAQFDCKSGAFTPEESAELQLDFGQAKDLHVVVAMKSSEWADYFAEGGWVNAVDAVIMNSDIGGWQQHSTPAWYPNPGAKPTPPPYYHDYYGTADEEFIYDWTFPSIDVYSFGWAQIFIATNYGGGTEADHGFFYIKSVTLTPEPATMALLGLGGLALIRRKK